MDQRPKIFWWCISWIRKREDSHCIFFFLSLKLSCSPRPATTVLSQKKSFTVRHGKRKEWAVWPYLVCDIRTSIGDLLAHLLEDTLVVIAVEELVACILVPANLVGLQASRLKDDNQTTGLVLLHSCLGHLGCLRDQGNVG